MDPRVGLSWLHEGMSPDQLGQFSFRGMAPRVPTFTIPAGRYFRSARANAFQSPARSSFQPDKSFALFSGMTISMRVTGNRAEVFVNDRYKIYDGPYNELVTAARQSTCHRNPWSSGSQGQFTCDGSLLLESARGRTVQVKSSMSLRVPAAGFVD